MERERIFEVKEIAGRDPLQRMNRSIKRLYQAGSVEVLKVERGGVGERNGMKQGKKVGEERETE